MHEVMPVIVARNILIHHVHPVKAWRNYYMLTPLQLARGLDCAVKTVEELESSNLHLHDQWLCKLIRIFNVPRCAVEIRFFNQGD